jgi:hypothetical protein
VFDASPVFCRNLKQCAVLCSSAAILKSHFVERRTNPSVFLPRCGQSRIRQTETSTVHLQLFTAISLLAWHSNLNRDLVRGQVCFASIRCHALLFSAMPSGTPLLRPAFGVRIEHQRIKRQSVLSFVASRSTVRITPFRPVSDLLCPLTQTA